MTEVIFNNASCNDAAEIIKLYNSQTGTSDTFVADCIDQYPSAVDRVNNLMVGFAYSKQFAPDILELENIYVAEKHRSQKIGQKLLHMIEVSARVNFTAIILVNSQLYPRAEPKRLATHFYVENGYGLVFDTADSNVFMKSLH